MHEILLLWKLSVKCALQDPLALFWSDSAMSNCISKIIADSKSASNISENEQIQEFISKLYEFRTRREIYSSQKKGIDSSVDLNIGQKLILVVTGTGVFSSKVLNNAHELTIQFPVLQNGKLDPDTIVWEKLPIIVYLWRKNDANYTFETVAIGSGTFRGESVLYLRHSNNLLRTQKRKTVRANCHIPATLYLLVKTENSSVTVTNSNIEKFSNKGYHCVLEDVSEAGALIRIGGKGICNIKIKLLFMLETEQIIMTGFVRSVEYNAMMNQSRLHLECPDIDQAEKNKILTFVYNIMPKEEIYAIEQLEKQQSDDKIESDAENESDEIQAEQKDA